MFNEADVVYQPEDIRFTVKGDNLYAIALAWPGEECIIHSFSGRDGRNPLYRDEIAEITMLGDDKPLKWRWIEGEWDEEEEELVGGGLAIETPAEKPCEHAYAFKIVRKYD